MADKIQTRYTIRLGTELAERFARIPKIAKRNMAGRIRRALVKSVILWERKQKR